MESSTKNHYALLAVDLRHELSTLDEEIDKRKERRAKIQSTLDFVEERVESMDLDEPGSDGDKDGPYSGLSLVEAAAKFLETVGQPMQTRAIADALVKGGYKTKSRNLYNNVYGTLNRESDKDSPRVIKNGARWTLPEDADSKKDEESNVSGELTREGTPP